MSDDSQHEDVKPARKRAPAAKKKAAVKKTAARGNDYHEGVVILSELRAGARDSESVRRLQTVLGVDATGDFDQTTQQALRHWQNTHGFQGGRGIQVMPAQARGLFGKQYDVRLPESGS